MPSSIAHPQTHSFFGHPRGLATLFFTEFWERFSYYGMRALLLLFMVAPVSNGGLGFSVAKGSAIYGIYASSVYLLSLPGGWLADRVLGQRKSVLYGGIIIACGHYCLAFPSLGTFYAGLALIVIGTGMLKPNVSTIVGQLYEPSDHRRDAGFSIFYMGINLGALIAPLACSYLGEKLSWHYGFALAGVGMTAGVIQYAFGQKHLLGAGEAPVVSLESRKQLTRLLLSAVTLAVVLAALVAIGVIAVSAEGLSQYFGVLLTVIVLAVFGTLLFAGQWTPLERSRLVSILVLFVAAAIFWSLFEQAGSTLNLFAKRNTDLTLFGLMPSGFPAGWFQSVQPIFLVILAPVFAWIWIKLDSRDPSSPTKFALGLLFAGAGFAILVPVAGGTGVSPIWLVLTYLLHTIGELLLSPVGLSATTKLAPPRVAGFMMGVWFLSLSVGDYIGGQVSSVYERFSLPTLFAVVGGVAILAGLLMFLAVPWVKRLMGGVS